MTTITLPEWTRETPTEPGLYRFRGEWRGVLQGAIRQPIWVDVWFHVRPRIAQGWVFGQSSPGHLKHASGEWQGPIVVTEAT